MEPILGKAAWALLKECRDQKLNEKEVLESIENQIKGGNLPASDKICPECSRNFSVISLPNITANMQLECCIFCKSLWFDHGELKTLTGCTREVPADNLAHRKSRFNCPVCQVMMREYLFFPRQNLLVDKCPDEHGIYLESSELKRIFELIR